MALLTAADLATAIALRYDGQRLKELTNPRDKTATTTNATKLLQACTSALAWFKVYVQAEADAADDMHVEGACDGVIAVLQRWGGSAVGVKRIKWDDWKDACDAIKNVGPRSHEGPETSSLLTPTDPDTSNGPARPDFDRSHFDRVIPTRNGSGSPSDFGAAN